MGVSKIIESTGQKRDNKVVPLAKKGHIHRWSQGPPSFRATEPNFLTDHLRTERSKKVTKNKF
jgi:hypothetical protein